MSYKDLPAFNASMNCLSMIFLLLGYYAIKKGEKLRHKKYMFQALISSTIFLISYLIYHAKIGSKPFPELGWIKTLYLTILIPHVVLAALMVPLIALTFYWALRQEWTKHRKIARVTFPIWLFVSLSGVLVYLMLYQFFITELPST